jgi:hypothetical protein
MPVMRDTDLAGISQHREVCTTSRDQMVRPVPNLNARDFTAAKPIRFWGSDVRTQARFLDLAIVRDAFGYRIVGRAMAWI